MAIRAMNPKMTMIMNQNDSIRSRRSGVLNNLFGGVLGGIIIDSVYWESRAEIGLTLA
jgi:hypothetical protein